MQRHLYKYLLGETCALIKNYDTDRGYIMTGTGRLYLTKYDFPVFDTRVDIISNLHKNVFICKNASESVVRKFSTYPHF